MVKTYKKQQGDWISDHFISDEFDCPCDGKCTTTLIDTDLIEKLEAVRKALGKALRINSGYRCQAYQDELRLRGYETSSGVSTHTLGKAADIMCEGVTGVSLEEVARASGFRAVGVGSNFIHVDTRNDRDRRWSYNRG